MPTRVQFKRVSLENSVDFSPDANECPQFLFKIGIVHPLSHVLVCVPKGRLQVQPHKYFFKSLCPEKQFYRAMTSGIRLSKQLSSVLRLCSRREADEWIGEGKVFINGAQAELGSKVSSGDKIIVRGTGEGPRTYQVEKATPSLIEGNAKGAFPRVFLANKRPGQICDRTKERNLFAEIEVGGAPKGLLVAGGLDVMASGLLVLTDSAKLRNVLEEARLNQIFYVSGMKGTIQKQTNISLTHAKTQCS
jgi:ribosomal 50S subunit-recycling heat shock protein